MFCHLTEAPPDPILGVAVAYRADSDPNKVDLGVGAYRCEDCKPYVFPVVREAEQKLITQNLNKEYLPIDGLATLKLPTQKLVFGDDCPAIQEQCIASTQVLSGTGGLRLVADFIRKLVPDVKTVFISRPSWANHRNIFGTTGFEVHEYAYWDAVDFDGMLRDIREAPERSLMVFHPCAHNPTGVDLNAEQWEEVLKVVKQRAHLPLFDMAYQGFASGDLDRDAAAIRLFQRAGLELFVCQSFAKNMGLYGERVGMLHVVNKVAIESLQPRQVCDSAERAKIVLSHLKPVIRSEYSSPPNWGARILEAIITNPEKTAAWKEQLKQVSARISSVRQQLRDGLVQKGTPGNWDHVTRQIGMFSYTGLTPAQCERLVTKWHIYLLKSGRISLAGLNKKNLPYVIEAIDDCVRNA